MEATAASFVIFFSKNSQILHNFTTPLVQPNLISPSHQKSRNHIHMFSQGCVGPNRVVLHNICARGIHNKRSVIALGAPLCRRTICTGLAGWADRRHRHWSSGLPCVQNWWFRGKLWVLQRWTSVINDDRVEFTRFMCEWGVYFHHKKNIVVKYWTKRHIFSKVYFMKYVQMNIQWFSNTAF